MLRVRLVTHWQQPVSATPIMHAAISDTAWVETRLFESGQDLRRRSSGGGLVRGALHEAHLAQLAARPPLGCAAAAGIRWRSGIVAATAVHSKLALSEMLGDALELQKLTSFRAAVYLTQSLCRRCAPLRVCSAPSAESKSMAQFNFKAIYSLADHLRYSINTPKRTMELGCTDVRAAETSHLCSSDGRMHRQACSCSVFSSWMVKCRIELRGGAAGVHACDRPAAKNFLRVDANSQVDHMQGLDSLT